MIGQIFRSFYFKVFKHALLFILKLKNNSNELWFIYRNVNDLIGGNHRFFTTEKTNMGNCGGKGSDAAGEHNKKLDKKIKEDGNMTNKEIKLLLLGSGESGKSKN
jgi:hypothetical protein